MKAGRFSWLGGKADPKQDALSARRAARHRRRGADAAGQRWATGGYCPAGYQHTGRCRHR